MHGKGVGHVRQRGGMCGKGDMRGEGVMHGKGGCAW